MHSLSLSLTTPSVGSGRGPLHAYSIRAIVLCLNLVVLRTQLCCLTALHVHIRWQSSNVIPAPHSKILANTNTERFALALFDRLWDRYMMCMHVRVCECSCERACVRACVRSCVRVCVNVCMRACVHTCVRACMHARKHAWPCVFVYACVCVCVFKTRSNTDEGVAEHNQLCRYRARVSHVNVYEVVFVLICCCMPAPMHTRLQMLYEYVYTRRCSCMDARNLCQKQATTRTHQDTITIP